MVVDPNWFQRFQANGINPTVVLDFENGLYWDGVQTLTNPSTLVGGSPTIDSTGMLCNASTFTAIGALLNAFQGGTWSTHLTAVNTVTTGVNAIISFGGDAPQFQNGTNYNGFRASGSTTLNYGVLNWLIRNRLFAVSSLSGNTRILSDGLASSATSASDANPYASPSSVQIGSFGGADIFGGHIINLAVVNTQWSTTFAPQHPAFTGSNGILATTIPSGSQGSNAVSYGNILQYEYTQPWTVIAAVEIDSTALPGTAAIIFTNVVTSSNFPGYEFWIDNNGLLRVRIIHDIGAGIYIGIIGTTNVCNGKYRVVAATYDGSGAAAGVKMYVDGFQESVTVESDTLGGQTIIGTNTYLIGNQTGLAFSMTGALSLFRQHNTVKSQSFIQQFKINQLLPALDSTCVLAPKFNEGGSSLITGDLSNSGYVGTLSSTSMWLRGISAPPIFNPPPSAPLFIPPSMVFM